jgi:ketosteroid isomerase-like protein
VTTNEEIARRGYEAALNGDLDAVKEFLDPDVKWHGGEPDAPGACRNRQEALTSMAPAIENRRIGELVDVRGAGDRVVVIMRPRVEPGEKPRLAANVTTFRDGRAIDIVHYPSPEDALASVSLSE